MTPQQRTILAKLEGKVSGHVAEISPYKIEWKQRRVKHGLTLWIAKVNGIYLANITDENNVTQVRGGGSYAVMHIDRLVNEFDALITPDYMNLLKVNPIHPDIRAFAQATLERLLLKYSRR